MFTAGRPVTETSYPDVIVSDVRVVLERGAVAHEKRRSLLLGLFAMTIGIGFGWPLAEDVPRATLKFRRSRGGRRARNRWFVEYFAFVFNSGVAVSGVVVGTSSILKAFKKDQEEPGVGGESGSGSLSNPSFRVRCRDAS